jgi:hypothetical protein
VLFLRDGGTRGGKEEDAEQANDSAHQRVSCWREADVRPMLATNLADEPFRLPSRLRVE